LIEEHSKFKLMLVVAVGIKDWMFIYWPHYPSMTVSDSPALALTVCPLSTDCRESAANRERS
jgi:hypothetical protein